jgi:hypothetical protein
VICSSRRPPGPRKRVVSTEVCHCPPSVAVLPKLACHPSPRDSWAGRASEIGEELPITVLGQPGSPRYKFQAGLRWVDCSLLVACRAGVGACATILHGWCNFEVLVCPQEPPQLGAQPQRVATPVGCWLGSTLEWATALNHQPRLSELQHY